MSKRILISTQAFPPITSGSSIILYELLRHLPAEEMAAVCGTCYPPITQLPSLGIEQRMILFCGSHRWTLRLARRFPSWHLALVRPRVLAEARRHQVRRIYAHFPDSSFLIAGWRAAEKLDLPLTVYFDYLWKEANTEGASQARNYEGAILHRADQRYAITEFAADYLQKKHGVQVDLLPHLIDASNLPGGLVPVADDGPPTIHFCGGIYPRMNQDSVLRLAAAAAAARVRPVLDLYAPELPAELARRGLTCRYLGRDELRLAQRNSSILFLPQAFESDYPLMIRHNFPTKAMEYFCSGRPILVHSPPDSYLTWLARREGFALVVDRPDVDELAAAIDRLARDKDLQAELVSRALAFVRTRDSKAWAEKFWEGLCR